MPRIMRKIKNTFSEKDLSSKVYNLYQPYTEVHT